MTTLKVLIIIAALAAIAYAAYAISKFLTQASHIYHPSADIIGTPASAGLKYEDIYFYSEPKIRLNGWWIPGPGDKTILVFHGNGGNISHRLELIKIFNQVGLNVFIIDYRGYGRSQGLPSEKGTYRDGMAALSYLTGDRGLGLDKIIIFGRSLGGPIAAELAAVFTPGGLVLDSTFTSIKDMGKHLYPSLPVRRFLQFDYNTLKSVAKVKCPVLLMHSKQDGYIPYHHALRLYQAIESEKELVTIAGTHSNGYLISAERYRKSIEKFIGLIENCKANKLGK